MCPISCFDDVPHIPCMHVGRTAMQWQWCRDLCVFHRCVFRPRYPLAGPVLFDLVWAVYGIQFGNRSAPTAKTFALGQPADPNNNFYIPTTSQVDELIRETQKGDKVLVRGPPSSGKSTVAQAMRRQYPYCKRVDSDRSFVYIPGQHLLDCEDAESVKKMIIEILNRPGNLGGDLPDFPNFFDSIGWLIQNSQRCAGCWRGACYLS